MIKDNMRAIERFDYKDSLVQLFQKTFHAECDHKNVTSKYFVAADRHLSSHD